MKRFDCGFVLDISYDLQIWNIFFAGRYIILMMGLFSVHSGLIFNDMFGKSMNIFGSKWRSRYDLNTVNNHHTFQMDPKDAFLNDPYPFGIDPIWSLSHDNKIVFLNSFKMKLSIIFGVSQMLFGVFMSLTNFIYFKDYVSIFLQFIPQIIFMCAIFVYLAILMFIKWFMYSTFNSLVSSETCAPQILITFINMMMFRGSDLKDPNCETPYIYANEEIIQKILLLIGLLCVPIMLLGKPCMEKRKRDREVDTIISVKAFKRRFFILFVVPIDENGHTIVYAWRRIGIIRIVYSPGH